MFDSMNTNTGDVDVPELCPGTSQDTSALPSICVWVPPQTLRHCRNICVSVPPKTHRHCRNCCVSVPPETHRHCRVAHCAMQSQPMGLVSQHCRDTSALPNLSNMISVDRALPYFMSLDLGTLDHVDVLNWHCQTRIRNLAHRAMTYTAALLHLLLNRISGALLHLVLYSQETLQNRP